MIAYDNGVVLIFEFFRCDKIDLSTEYIAYFVW